MIPKIDLPPGVTFAIVFVGFRSGLPEVSPYDDQVVVYGWEGSEVAVFENGSLAIPQSSIEEIIQQEFQLLKDRIERTNEPFPTETIAWAQEALDKHPELGRESSRHVQGLTAILILALAPCFSRSNAAVQMLWRIAGRLLATRGFALGMPGRVVLDDALWRESALHLEHLIAQQSMSMLPRRAAADLAPRRDATPRNAESESDPKTV